MGFFFIFNTKKGVFILNNPVTEADLRGKVYREQYGVVIVCPTEAEQERVYNEALSAFPDCKIKVVTV